MRHIKLAHLDVGRIGLGTMGMSAFYAGAGLADDESFRTIHRGLNIGVTLIDTAEACGSHKNEELVGRALKGRRDQVMLASKFGLISHDDTDRIVDSRPENSRVALEGTTAISHLPFGIPDSSDVDGVAYAAPE
jgi:aryl-alcohol dehydrogenase-like predicted oxidoreductase